MLTNKQIIKILNHSFYNSEEKCENNKNKIKGVEKTGIFVPVYSDTLFWCFFICLKGKYEYECVSKSGFKEEREFKMNFVETLKPDKYFFKKHKLKYVDIEGECINSKSIGYNSLQALCLFYNINIMLVVNKSYYKFGSFVNDNVFIIYKKEAQSKHRRVEYGLNENENTEKKAEYIEKNYILLENGKKPLKAISNYSASELKIMNQKLGLSIYNDNQKVQVKKELYNQLLENIF